MASSRNEQDYNDAQDYDNPPADQTRDHNDASANGRRALATAPERVQAGVNPEEAVRKIFLVALITDFYNGEPLANEEHFRETIETSRRKISSFWKSQRVQVTKVFTNPSNKRGWAKQLNALNDRLLRIYNNLELYTSTLMLEEAVDQAILDTVLEIRDHFSGDKSTCWPLSIANRGSRLLRTLLQIMTMKDTDRKRFPQEYLQRSSPYYSSGHLWLDDNSKDIGGGHCNASLFSCLEHRATEECRGDLHGELRSLTASPYMDLLERGLPDMEQYIHKHLVTRAIKIAREGFIDRYVPQDNPQSGRAQYQNTIHPELVPALQELFTVEGQSELFEEVQSELRTMPDLILRVVEKIAESKSTTFSGDRAASSYDGFFSLMKAKLSDFLDAVQKPFDNDEISALLESMQEGYRIVIEDSKSRGYPLRMNIETACSFHRGKLTVQFFPTVSGNYCGETPKVAEIKIVNVTPLEEPRAPSSPATADAKTPLLN